VRSAGVAPWQVVAVVVLARVPSPPQRMAALPSTLPHCGCQSEPPPMLLRVV
jgi:hypothetical protein